jgi:hypothetical protein
MGVPARAAVERRKAGAPRMARSRPNADEWRKPRPLVCAAAHGWHAPFGASPPFYFRGRVLFLRVVRTARAHRRSENDAACASLRASRSNPDGLRGNLDCFVAVAPRNDEPAREAQRGRGTARRAVEGTSSLPPRSDLPLPARFGAPAPPHGGGMNQRPAANRPMQSGPTWLMCSFPSALRAGAYGGTPQSQNT